MTGSAGSLTDAIESGVSGSGIPSLTAGVQRLMSAYRSGTVPDAPVMASRADAAAYAAYRMPATSAATALAVREMRLSLPGWAPATLLDIGAGTGGASWAIADQVESLRTVTLLEQSADAIRLGRAILAASASAALRSARWQSWQLPASASGAPAGSASAGGASAGGASADGRDPAGPVPAVRGPADLPPADLVSCAYVLGELTPAQQEILVALAGRAAPAVLLVEPGTPAGHQRILAARAQLLEAGYQVAAPCPHQLACPLAAAGDWCHFGVRLQRSSVHRQVKGAELSYEDEKFSYVAMSRAGQPAPRWPAARIVRRPQRRKGLVLLEECAGDGTSRRELVSKSKGELYRQARKASWGDRFPPPDPDC